jgi:hypothetical protein
MASKMLLISSVLMDYVKPIEVTKNILEAAAAKAALSVSDFLIRGFLSGAILGFATSLAYRLVALESDSGYHRESVRRLVVDRTSDVFDIRKAIGARGFGHRD